MEDARFTRFIDDAGDVEYRATYTAYDGRQIAPRLLRSPDLRRFRTYRLAGRPRGTRGWHCSPHGERPPSGPVPHRRREHQPGLLPDGLLWSAPTLLHRPTRAWEVMQVGNCGPPIETACGWLVLTHGVGPMRTYAIGAILLDTADPQRVIGALPRPLLAPNDSERDGYVPNVVYSCGGLVHDGRLWLPYGIDDSRIGVAWVDLDELLAELLRSPPPAS